MKTRIRYIVVIFLFCSLYALQSCSSKNEVWGSLTVTVKDHQGQPIVNELVSLATSLENLNKKVYLKTGYTDANGAIMFRELAPQYYYYKTDDYKGIGADDVFSTIDQYVILFVEPL